MTRVARLLALVLVVGLTTTACSALPFGGNGTYELSADFSRTFNIFPGSPVRVLGVEVGKIKELTISPDRKAVRAVMIIDEGVQVPAEAGAVVIPEALLGERYIQLTPPYTGGAAMEPGETIPLERTQVPAEFDEVLESLNDFVRALDEDEIGRFFANLADVLDGQGEQLGRTLDSAHGAIEALQQSDEEIVALASRLADLNATLATRDEAMGEIIEDWNTFTASLANDRVRIDAALEGLVRMTREVGDLVGTHRADLDEDIDTLARIGRTAQRNIDNLSLLTLGSAELFRHAERVIERDRNWLPLLDHKNAESLYRFIAEDLADRLAGLCGRSEDIPDEVCDEIPFEELIGDQVCVPEIMQCPEDGSIPTLTEAVRNVARGSEAFREAVGGSDSDSADRAPADIADAARRIAEENAAASNRLSEGPR